jgi:hypothetical protein
LRTVLIASLVARATFATPPRPIASASAPAHSRRLRSSSVAFNKRHFWRTSCSASNSERRSYQHDPVDPQIGTHLQIGRPIDRLSDSRALWLWEKAFGSTTTARQATAPGSEVQHPPATVVIGGIQSATLLTMLLLPLAYTFFAGSGSTARGPSGGG